jgi:uncharacterized protein
MLSLPKLLIIALVIAAVYYFFFRKVRPLTEEEEEKPKKKRDKKLEEIMVECAKCGTFVSPKEALIKDGSYFCSKACAGL